MTEPTCTFRSQANTNSFNARADATVCRYPRGDDAAKPKADAGVTSSGDSFYLDLMMHRSSSRVGGTTGLGGGVQLGLQNEVKFVLIGGVPSSRGPKPNPTDILAADVHVGIHNADGSTGFNLGASAVFAQDRQVKDHGDGSSSSVSEGLKVSVGFSVGTRDADNDGKQERCYSVELPFYSWGRCSE